MSEWHSLASPKAAGAHVAHQHVKEPALTILTWAARLQKLHTRCHADNI